MSLRAPLPASFISLLMLSTPAFAYKYNSLVTKPVHEALTMLAEGCVRDQPGGVPTDCLHGQQIKHRWSAHKNRPKTGLWRRFTPRALDARWPDNPTHAGALGIVHALKFPDRCAQLRDGATPEHTGLLCEGHTVSLQFIHAQSPVPRGADNKPLSDCGVDGCVSSEMTRRLLVDWLAFNFDVHSNAIDGAQRLCDAIDRKMGSEHVYGEEFRKAMHIDPLCQNNITVAVLYTSTCRGKLRYGYDKCKVLRGTTADTHKQRALGAVLHGIQDSYSQSHARRTAQRPDPFASVATCGAVQEFYEYTGGYHQTEHSLADSWPTLDGCAAPHMADNTNVDNVIVDPVTASAAAIWYFERSDREGFLDYVDGRILGL
ncbi:MAG: hypothetical protein ACI9MC_000825 [Kiritimatiellia bacterium]|jgi:hypothetical protein